MHIIRPSESRGKANHGWLQSRHTFSFARYYDPEHMGVSVLRVINDDEVIPGAGFSTHSHQDMEILSYVKQGTIEHKDNMGNIERLPASEFQLMSAGTGITHSEYNPSDHDSLTFLQIWIEPNVMGIEPQYQQKRFDPAIGLTPILSPDGRDGTLEIHQAAFLHRLMLTDDKRIPYPIEPGRVAYVHVVQGKLIVDGAELREGDGMTITDVDKLCFAAMGSSEALLFDLPPEDT